MAQPDLEKKTFKQGEDLFKEGEQGREAYLIQNGFVSIWREQDGQKVSLATRGEGEIVGEMALIDDTVRSATVTAGSEVEADVITREVLLGFLDQSPPVLSVILHQLLESLRSSNDLLAMYATRINELQGKG
mgnify:CR=1 FL=1